VNWLGVVATIVGPGGVVVVVLGALLERVRRENNRDHNRNSELLKSIDSKVDRVSNRMDDHIDWHITRGQD